MTIDEKITKLHDAGYNIPFIEYYTHLYTDCYKILNPFTEYAEEKTVLCTVSDGFEHALDLAIMYFV